MTELTTKKNEGTVQGFLRSIPDERKRKESRALLKRMREITGERPTMWGPSIV